MQQFENDGFEERVVHVNRVAKVVKGGRRFSFSALVVAGDMSGQVGYGIGKAGEVPAAISKASRKARLNLIKVPIFILLTLMHPESPMFTRQSLTFDLAMVPLILCGVFLGKWVLAWIPQKLFDTLVLLLAGLAAIRLLL